MEIDWSHIGSALGGMIGGGWFVRLLLTRHLKQLDETYKDIHAIKTDIAVIKDKLVAISKLEDKVADTHDRLLKLEETVHQMQVKGCTFRNKPSPLCSSH